MKHFIAGILFGIVITSVSWMYVPKALFLIKKMNTPAPEAFVFPKPYTPQNTQIYTDTAKKFTFLYPAEWKISTTSDEYHKNDPNYESWVKEYSKDVEFLVPNQGDAMQVVWITQCYELPHGENSYYAFHYKYDDFILHSNKITHKETVFKADVESWLLQEYFIESPTGECIDFLFRQSGDNPMNSTHYDFTNLLPTFEFLVDSFKFTETSDSK